MGGGRKAGRRVVVWWGLVGWVEVGGRGRGWQFKSGKELLGFAREAEVRSVP